MEIKRGFICVLDALGTKGVWKQKSPIDVVEIFKSLKRLKSDAMRYVIPKSKEIKYNFFSDSIIISFQDKSKSDDEFIDNVHLFARDILTFFYNALMRGIKYRGAISYGEYYKSEEFIVGPAIDDAAMYYDKYDWIGISLTPKTSYLMKSKGIPIEKRILDDNEYRLYFKDYKAPLKSCSTPPNVLSLNWPLFIYKTRLSKVDIVSLKKILLDILSQSQIPLEALSKYENTIAFFDSTIDETVNTINHLLK